MTASARSGKRRLQPRRRIPPRGPLASVTSVRVEGIFGEFDYEIRLGGSEDDHRLAVLYGDNGTGKTTFLKCVFHSLSFGAQHLAELSRLPFRTLEVKFDNTSVLSVTKREELVGGYDLKLRRRTLPEISVFVPYLSGVRDRSPFSEGEFRELSTAMRNLALPPILVRDDRSVESDEFDAHAAADLRYLSPIEIREMAQGATLLSWARTRELETALERAETVLRTAAIGGLSSGGSATQSIYVDVTKRILSVQNDKSSAESKEQLERAVAAIQARGPSFTKYELLPLDQVDAISRELTRARRNAARLPLLSEVLGPYLDGLSAQLDDLEDARQRIDTYITAVNGFLQRKRLDFGLARGISLLGKGAEEISPEALSSGEKHLLLLFSYAVVARDRGGLFIIDEPELSLGIEWKRSLLREMLRCTSGGKVQFIVASHSVEVMSPYRHRLFHPVENHAD